MGLATIISRTLQGIDAPEVHVEVHMANGLPQFTLVGLADTEVKEARERVRAAILNCGLEFPHNQRITCSLAPADLPKESGRLDLPIALGILVASGQIPAQGLENLEFCAELSLAGELRPVKGALAMAMALMKGPSNRQLVLPHSSAREAALACGARALGARSLLEVVQVLRGELPLSQWAVETGHHQAPSAGPMPDFSEIRGQSAAKRALEVAATGGHSVLLVGPPGSGKSMLADRFVGILPPMDATESLQSAAMLSLAGLFQPQHFGQRVMRSPHHHTSAAALVGGGRHARPGEISLAHQGLLFLDELPEFSRTTLESLREPMETGHITIARANHRANYPARFQLIAAMNPCPCGHLGATDRPCRCTPEQVARYRGRLSGPLLDRIDMQIEVRPVDSRELMGATATESSLDIRQRVQVACAKSLDRQGCRNRDLTQAQLDAHCHLDAPGASLLHRATQQLGWSSRGVHRCLKLARTIADLDQSDQITSTHLAEATQYRRVLAV